MSRLISIGLEKDLDMEYTEDSLTEQVKGGKISNEGAMDIKKRKLNSPPKSTPLVFHEKSEIEQHDSKEGILKENGTKRKICRPPNPIRRTLVFEYFTPNLLDTRYVECNLCSTRISRGSAVKARQSMTPLYRHLKTHPKTNEEYEDRVNSLTPKIEDS